MSPMAASNRSKSATVGSPTVASATVVADVIERVFDGSEADLVVAETTCDGKKKMYEIMAETRPMVVLELPQREDDEAGQAHWEAELRRLCAELERRFGVPVTTARLREAIRLMNRERGLRRRLAALMKADRPPLTGRELLDFKGLISGIPSDLEQYERALAAWEGQPGRADLAGRVRVLLTGVPVVHGAEKVVDLAEEHGGLIVAMENCTGLKPILDDVDESAEDPLRAIAEKYAHLPCSVMTPNTRRLDSLRRLVPEYRAECVVELVWQACLTYDVESHRVRRLVETELGLPYLRIETDYSPSDAARIALRLEALYEMVRARRARQNTIAATHRQTPASPATLRTCQAPFRSVAAPKPAATELASTCRAAFMGSPRANTAPH